MEPSTKLTDSNKARDSISFCKFGSFIFFWQIANWGNQNLTNTNLLFLLYVMVNVSDTVKLFDEIFSENSNLENS